MDLETQATERSKALMMVLQDQVSAGQAHLGQLQQIFIPWCTNPSPVPLCLSSMGYNLFGSHLSHEVFFLLPSHPKSKFLNKAFSLSLPKHPVTWGLFRYKLLGKSSLPVIFQDKTS